MGWFQWIVIHLWWGSFRKPFEAVARRLTKRSTRILTGPLKGMWFRGGLAQILGIYEPYIQKALIANLRKGDVFYDIGANNGFFTLLGAVLVGPEGHVFAFEPFPENVSRIQQAIGRNHKVQCTVVDVAVSDKSGCSELFFSGNNATPSIFSGSADGASLKVKTITLDEFTRNSPKPSLIKMDVEGAEAAVLQGALSLLSGDKAPDWIIEIHSPAAFSVVQENLAEKGYTITLLPRPGRQKGAFPCHILAVKE